MKKLNTAQKVILVLGIIGTIVGIYGKWNGWDHKSYFIPLYTGLSFMWVAFLNSDSKCEVRYLKRIFGIK
ncbi:hypothetical protein GTQ34_13315 [Muricauda sp. JGD-17]|uniref:Uncharacterized protein n=1 Tax=Flagellimonas ochracea TaxID=2696472 RepID=A0A964TFK9_9FLAO|nr:hypothetical protein [Allomuricauda ochracea]NAY92896.1 hypothetical protein [Allomuricauda ochracea]